MRVSQRIVAQAMLLACLLLALMGCDDGSGNLDSFADPPDEPGPFGVGHDAFTAIDAVRDNRSLPVDVWYPVDSEQWQSAPPTSYPLADGINLDSELAVEGLPVSKRGNQSLVVFSHGYGGTNTQSVELMEALASHGFIVVSPEHTGNSQASNGDSFDTAAANRVPDLTFIIDTMTVRSETPGDSFYKAIDPARVGVVGHSFGGMTAIGAAAGWAGSAPDSRVAAIVPISAVIDAGLQSDTRTSPNAGFNAAQLAGITVPVMLMGGTADVSVFPENNAIAFEQIIHATALYKVDIIGATHTHFANVCAIGRLLIDLGITQDIWPVIGAQDLLEPFAVTCSEDAFPIEEAVRLQNLFVVSFFRRHLLGETAYDDYLDPGYTAGEPAASISVK